MTAGRIIGIPEEQYHDWARIVRAARNLIADAKGITVIEDSITAQIVDLDDLATAVAAAQTVYTEPAT